MKTYKFSTVQQWIEALLAGAPVGIMSTSLAAEALGEAEGSSEETVGSLSRKLKEGKIGSVTIQGKRYISAEAIHMIITSGNSQFNKLYEMLVDTAARGEKTTYGEVMAKLGMDTQSPPDRKRIGVLLGQVCHRSWEEDGIFLSSLVHRKGSEPTAPGPGYLGLVESIKPSELKKYTDPLEMVLAHMKAVWSLYCNNKK